MQTNILSDGVKYHFNEIVSDNFVFFLECDKKLRVGEEELSPLTVGLELQKAYQQSINYNSSACDVFSASGLSQSCTKMSIHVRFYNRIVKDVHEAQILVSKIKEASCARKDILETIDEQPISSRMVQLRLPFCDKPNEDRKLRYYCTLTASGECQKHWDEDVLRRSSLIRIIPGRKRHPPIHLISEQAYFTFSKRMKFKDGEVLVQQDCDDVLLDDVLRYYLSRFEIE